MAMAPDQLACENSNQRNKFLFQSGQWSDCKFLVGTKPDQEVIDAHKVILASASPVFAAMFYGEMAESQSPIPIPDIQPEPFRTMLRYIYFDEIPPAAETPEKNTNFVLACKLYYAAKKYILPHLLKECTKLLEFFTYYPEFICPIYELATLYDETALVLKCLKIISSNTKSVLSRSKIEELQFSTMVTIFSLDKISCTEMDLFEAAKRYAEMQENIDQQYINDNISKSEPLEDKSHSTACPASNDILPVKMERSTETGPVEPEPKSESLEDDDRSTESKENQNYRDLIKKIRFLTMTADEFVEGPVASGLLTESEGFSILVNIVSTKSVIPMPSGFSTSRQRSATSLSVERRKAELLTTFYQIIIQLAAPCHASLWHIVIEWLRNEKQNKDAKK